MHHNMTKKATVNGSDDESSTEIEYERQLSKALQDEFHGSANLNGSMAVECEEGAVGDFYIT